MNINWDTIWLCIFIDWITKLAVIYMCSPKLSVLLTYTYFTKGIRLGVAL